MANSQRAIVVITNLPDVESAQALARYIIEQQLAACVNCLPSVHSLYRWQGEIEQAAEVTLLIKSTQARYGELEAAIKARHPYQVPEIIAIPIIEGWAPYLDWIVQETQETAKDENVQDG